MIDRRNFVAQAAVLGVGLAGGRRLWAHLGATAYPAKLTIYKSATCGCCAKWVDHRQSGRLRDRGARREGHGRGERQSRSTQGTSLLPHCSGRAVRHRGSRPGGGYPRLLDQKPKVAGLAVPGMPRSSPGMAVPGEPTSRTRCWPFSWMAAPRCTPSTELRQLVSLRRGHHRMLAGVAVHRLDPNHDRRDVVEPAPPVGLGDHPVHPVLGPAFGGEDPVAAARPPACRSGRRRRAA